MISEIVMNYFYIFFRYKNYQKKLFLHDPSNKQGFYFKKYFSFSFFQPQPQN